MKIKTIIFSSLLFTLLFSVVFFSFAKEKKNKDSSQNKPPFANSFFYKKLPLKLSLDKRSKERVKELTRLAFGKDPSCQKKIDNCQRKTYLANISTDAYSPVLFRATQKTKRREVILDYKDPSLVRAFKSVPIPKQAQPAQGTDGQLLIYQNSSDTLWELWRARREDGVWHASWGGRIRNVSQSPGYYKNVVKNNQFIEKHSWGASATSLAHYPGLIKARELKHGHIHHALNFAILVPKVGEYKFPAQREDGRCLEEMCSQIPEGAMFRLKPTYNTSKIKNKYVRTLAKAAQDYGMILNNRTGGGFNFYAEGWRGKYTKDPYYGSNGLFSKKHPTVFLQNFPWQDLQMLKSKACFNENVPCDRPHYWRK